MNNIIQLLDLSVVWDYRQLLIRGILINLQVFALASVLAVLFGLILASISLRGPRPLRAVATAFAELVRNVPEYVLIIWLYIALPFLLSRMVGTRIGFDPMTTAVVALALVFGGYFAETFRAGFQATPPGQREAASALGMMPRAITTRILLPQILLRLAPELLNVSISLFKTTSIVSLIGIQDLMYQASLMSSQLMRPIPIYTSAALVFVGVTLVASLGVRLLTRVLQQRIA